jgi:GT2 family glycosyltransferase
MFDDPTPAEVSVVIPNYNGRTVLPVALNSLRSQTFRNFEVVVVDNGSSDGSVEFLEESFPEARIVRLLRNLGFAGGVNEGIRRTNRPFVALLNNDVEVDPKWLEELYAAMAGKPHVGACQPKIIRYFERDRFDVVGLRLSGTGMIDVVGGGEKDVGQYDECRYLFGVNAGAALYRRSMLDDVGLFDEQLITSYEDADLSFRAQLAGWSALYVPTAVAHHMVGSTRKRRKYYGTYLFNRNKVLVFWKNMPAETIRDQWPAFFSYQVEVLVKRVVLNFWKVRSFCFLGGVLSAYLKIGYLRRERKIVQSGRRVPPGHIKALLDKDFLEEGSKTPIGSKNKRASIV